MITGTLPVKEESKEKKSGALAELSPTTPAERYSTLLGETGSGNGSGLARAKLLNQLQTGYGNRYTEKVITGYRDRNHEPVEKEPAPKQITPPKQEPTLKKTAPEKEPPIEQEPLAREEMPSEKEPTPAKEELPGELPGPWKAAAAAPEPAVREEKPSPAAAIKTPAKEEKKERPSARGKGAKESPAAAGAAPDAGAAGEPGGAAAFLIAAGENAFKKTIRKIRRLGKRQKTHKPAGEKFDEAKKAVVPPAAEPQSRAEQQQVETVDKRDAPQPDEAAAQKTLDDAIKQATPTSIEDVDNFKEQGKAQAIRGSVFQHVRGKTQAVNRTYEDIGTAPEAEPAPIDSSPVPEPEEAPPTPALKMGKDLLPTLPEEQTDLSSYENEVEDQIAKEEIDPENLAMVDSGPLAEANTLRKQVKEEVKNGPAEIKKKEQDEKSLMEQELEADEKSARSQMTQQRKANLGNVKAKQGAFKTKEEEKRKKVTTDIRDIYQKAKKTVETKLSILEKITLKYFDKELEKAAARFENRVKQEMKIFKAKRYSGFTGGLVMARDWLLGMDELPEVKAIFDNARKAFVSEIDNSIKKIKDETKKVIGECKAEVIDAKDRIAAYVKNLGPDLKKIAAATRKEMIAKLDALDKQVGAREKQLEEKLTKRRENAIKAIDKKIAKMKEKLKGALGKLGKLLLEAALKFFKWALKKAGAPEKRIMATLKRAGTAIKIIIKHPIRFLGNLIDALGGGFRKFSDNIAEHLKRGLMSWLFGTMAKEGIAMPTEFTIKAIFGLVMQVLGLTADNIKKKAAKYIGEENVERISKVWEFISTLISQGPAGLWDMMKEHLANLKDIVIEGIKEWLIARIIKQAVLWIISLFNPVAAIIKAVMAIYKVVMFIIERIQEIMQVVEAILSSLVEIATGAIGKASDWIEKTLGRLVPVVIGFLASLLGIGGITAKIREIIKKIQKRVHKALDKVIAKIASKVGKLLGKEKKESKVDPKKSQDEQSREQRKNSAANEVMLAMKKGIRRKRLKGLLRKLKKEHKLKSIVLNNKDDVVITCSAPKVVKGDVIEEDIRVSKESEKGRRKKLAEGGKMLGKFTAAAPAKNTVRGALESHVEGQFPYPAMPASAQRPSQANAELYGGVHGIDRVQGTPGLKNVNELGNLEEVLKSGGKVQEYYHSGHLIANEFGGPDGFENLVPQRGTSVNVGVYRDIERWVRTQLPDLDKIQQDQQEVNLTMTVSPSYTGNINITAAEAAKRLNMRLDSRYYGAGALKKKAKKRLDEAPKGSKEHEKAQRFLAYGENLLSKAEERKALSEEYLAEAASNAQVTVPSRVPGQMTVTVVFKADMDDKGNLTAEEKQKTAFKHRKKGRGKVVSSDPVIVVEGTSQAQQSTIDRETSGSKPKTKKVNVRKVFVVTQK